MLLCYLVSIFDFFSKLELNDCIRNTTAVCNPRKKSKTKFSPRQNSIRDKIQSGKKSEKNIFLSEIKFCQNKLLEKLVLDVVSYFQCAK